MAGYLNGDDEGEPGRRIAGRKWLPQVLPTHYRDVGTGGGREGGADFGPSGPKDFGRYDNPIPIRSGGKMTPTALILPPPPHIFRPSYGPALCAENQ